MVKHAHPEFPSDLFVILEAAGAQITIGNQQNAIYLCENLCLILNVYKVITILTLYARGLEFNPWCQPQ